MKKNKKNKSVSSPPAGSSVQSSTNPNEESIHGMDWSELPPELPIEDQVEDAVSLPEDADEQFEPVKKKKGRDKGKTSFSRSKATDKDEPKIDRQIKSYSVTSNDISEYTSRHRVSDKMYKFYLRKRIGYECSKVKRRLSKQEVKKLFAPVRALCLEILASVRIKRKLNVEKKIVVESIHKSTGSTIKWSDIVKGRKNIPPAQKDILITAKDDKIKRQSSKIGHLEKQIADKDKLITSLQSTIANLNDRLKVLEDKERNRRQKDPFSDRKKLATSGSALCHYCLPPTVYIYKKPLSLEKSDRHGEIGLQCVNCVRRKVYLSSGRAIPIFDAKNDGSDIYLYPEGFSLVETYQSLKNQVVDETTTGSITSRNINIYLRLSSILQKGHVNYSEQRHILPVSSSLLEVDPKAGTRKRKKYTSGYFDDSGNYRRQDEE